MSSPRPQFHLFKRYDRDLTALRAAIRSDPAVRAEAEAELAAVSPIGDMNPPRCAVSAEYAAILREALT